MKFKKTPMNVARLLFWGFMMLGTGLAVLFILATTLLSVETMLLLSYISFIFAFDRVQVIAEGG